MQHSVGMDINVIREHLRIPLRVKRLVQRAVTHPVLGWIISRHFKQLIPNWDCKIYAPLPFRVVAKIYWKFYEKSEVLLVRRYLRDDLDVIELGSSIGVVSSHIAKKLTPGRKLICVEANPGLIPLIRHNLDLNAPHLHAVIVNAAIDYSGRDQVPLYLGVTNTDSAIGIQGADYVEVNTLTLADLVCRHEISDFVLVCDIEGSEWGIILNEVETLKRCKQLIIELHQYQSGDQIISVERMKNLLIAVHGFDLRLHRGNVFLFER